MSSLNIQVISFQSQSQLFKYKELLCDWSMIMSTQRKAELQKSLLAEESNYETITEFIINHIKKTFDQGNDIAKEMPRLP